MKNTFKILGFFVFFAVIGFYSSACKNDPDVKENPKWRNELTYANNPEFMNQKIGYWYNSNSQVIGFYGDFTDTSNNYNEAYFTPQFEIGLVFMLYSTNDKPAGAESSFTLRTGETDKTTVKYILSNDGNSIEIIDFGYFNYLQPGIFTKSND